LTLGALSEHLDMSRWAALMSELKTLLEVGF